NEPDRPAVLKRLGRLLEAEVDFGLARKHATGDFETAYIAYNVACVCAIQGRRDGLIEAMRSPQRFAGRSDAARSIRAHLKDYFAPFASDAEFMGRRIANARCAATSASGNRS